MNTTRPAGGPLRGWLRAIVVDRSLTALETLDRTQVDVVFADLRMPGPDKIGFVRDATTLQLQRLCLSPLFYGIAMGGQWLMLNWNFARELSVAVPFGVAILITRALHTVWLLKADPQVLQEYEDWQRQRRARDAAEDAARAAANRAK